MSDIWIINNGYNLGTVQESNFITGTGIFNLHSYVYSSLTDTKFKVISGKIPPGLSLVNGVIYGAPNEVARSTQFRFVIRATIGSLISDRTFTMTVEGSDVPAWVTNAGALDVGKNQSFYVLDESYVNFQLLAIDTDTMAGQHLKFWIASGDGILPPGLELSDTGRIFGWAKPLILIHKPDVTGFYGTTLYDSYGYDYGVLNETSGYDNLGYDELSYDYVDLYPSPKKLNRNYEFIVTITDGDSSIRRKFSIYVVADDSLTVDSTITDADSILFTSDVALVREPVWITESNLGVYRASNYVTIKLDIYKTVDNLPVSYFLNTYNPDGTVSILPPGLQFDNVNAELFGIIPYHPDVTRQFTFTITAIRIGHLQEIVPDVTTEETPILIDNTLILYRNTTLEGDSFFRVFSSLLYVEDTHGVILTRSSDLLWKYHNNDIGLTLYSNAQVSDPWDVDAWYSDEACTIELFGPSIELITPSPGSVFSNEYESSSSSRTFELSIIGEVDSSVTWVTPSDLGTLEPDHVCDLFIKATAAVPLYYRITSGILPPGLRLSASGELIGTVQQYSSEDNIGLYKTSDSLYATIEWSLDHTKGITFDNVTGEYYDHDLRLDYTYDTNLTLIGQTVGPRLTKINDNQYEAFKAITSIRSGLTSFDFILDGGYTTIDRSFEFEVTVSDNINGMEKIHDSKSFYLLVNTPNIFKFSNILARPFLKSTSRQVFEDFITDTDIFEYDAIYRPSDPNFGIRHDLAMLIYSGIQLQEYSKFMSIITKRKHFLLGDVKIAKAKIYGTNTDVYEVIYIDVIDPLEYKGQHLPNVIYTSPSNDYITIDDDNITIDSNVYIINDPNMKLKFPSSISLWRSQIKKLGVTDRRYMPLWMRTIQDGSMVELDYIPAIPLCYCKPGKATSIIANIKNSKFNFNNIDYDIDRFIVSEVVDYYKDTIISFRNDRTVIA